MSNRELHPDLSDAHRERLLARGIELFNAGRYFDAHEPWEEIWRSTNPEPRDLFQGLVQVAAALHIWRERGWAVPAARVLGRGMGRLDSQRPAALGLDVTGLLAELERWRQWFRGQSGPEPPVPRIHRAPVGQRPP